MRSFALRGDAGPVPFGVAVFEDTNLPHMLSILIVDIPKGSGKLIVNGMSACCALKADSECMKVHCSLHVVVFWDVWLA